MAYGNHSGKRGVSPKGGMKGPKFGDSGCHALAAGKSKTNPMGNPGKVNRKERSSMKGTGY